MGRIIKWLFLALALVSLLILVLNGIGSGKCKSLLGGAVEKVVLLQRADGAEQTEITLEAVRQCKQAFSGVSSLSREINRLALIALTISMAGVIVSWRRKTAATTGLQDQVSPIAK